MKPNASIVFVDNFDSFTYNLVDQFRSLDYPVTVFRNSVPAEQIEAHLLTLPSPLLLLSPGPGAPADAGCMPELIHRMKGKVPIIGICLGHQALVEAYGGEVAGAGDILHGKASSMTLQPHAIFEGLASPMVVARYHSLAAKKVPDTLRVIASVDDTVMAVVNDEEKVVGFQFHPESILTTQGAELLTNTIQWAMQSPKTTMQHIVEIKGKKQRG